MYDIEKKRMKVISNYAGERVDYVQAGGGNTSYKFNDKLMAIKASGYSLAEIDLEKGYVTVDYAAIKDSYAKLAQKLDSDVEKETLEINLNCIVLLEGMENRRPSVEVGFHSYLHRAVVHTHSVCSNLLCCSVEGEEVMEKIFGNSEFGYISIPFISPGFRLSMHIKQETDKYEEKYGRKPDLIFMESHGIISSNDDYKKAVDIHEEANEMIKEYFNTIDFPDAGIEKCDGGFVSKTPFIHDFIKSYNADEEFFAKTILYPDQMVYLGNNLGQSILIDSTRGSILYKMGEKQAKATEEVILAVAYIISEINRNGLTLKLLCDEGIEFIRNWESEKYRASLAGK